MSELLFSEIVFRVVLLRVGQYNQSVQQLWYVYFDTGYFVSVGRLLEG